jgi:hypothetical protein
MMNVYMFFMRAIGLPMFTEADVLPIIQRNGATNSKWNEYKTYFEYERIKMDPYKVHAICKLFLDSHCHTSTQYMRAASNT